MGVYTAAGNECWKAKCILSTFFAAWSYFEHLLFVTRDQVGFCLFYIGKVSNNLSCSTDLQSLDLLKNHITWDDG